MVKIEVAGGIRAKENLMERIPLIMVKLTRDTSNSRRVILAQCYI